MPEGFGNNILRFSYTHQDEPRSFVGDLFPSVDILQYIDEDDDGVAETPALLTSFGPDPYTYGNCRNVSITQVTDEISTYSEFNSFTFGAQFEYDHSENGYMQAGAGYYVYDSWEDFKNNASPIAFAITYGNNSNREQTIPSVSFMQGSLYIQDVMKVSKFFDLSLGLRTELPYYPSIADYNTNQEFLTLANSSTTFKGLSTADMPKTYINLLPRLGFNWDLTYGDRLFVMSGGTGLFSSRLPYCWIVSPVSNSNCLQRQYVSYDGNVSFLSSPEEIIAYNSSLLTIGDMPAPQMPTIIDKDLRMPKTWRSTLTLSSELPGEVVLSVEGNYNKEIQSVAVSRLGIVKDGTILLPGEPNERDHWVSEGIKNSEGKNVMPFYLTNTTNNGYNMFLTAQLSKTMGKNLKFIAAYTYGEGKNVNDGIAQQISSAYSTNTSGINGSNAHELGYASYITPNRFLLYAGLTFGENEYHSNTLGIYYEGRNLAFIGGYSACRYSYTMTTDVNGDLGANSLLYIPTQSELFSMPFADSDNMYEYNRFIESDKYLSAHRGQYAERGGAISPMFHTINLHYTHDFIFDPFKLQLGFELKNVGNLVDRSWGNIQRLNTNSILKWDGNNYSFITPQWSEYGNTISTWSAAFNVRFSF